ncbi:RNI-like protein [Saitoella complicata NRRL Y-17804]|uniref:RNI-like protein n=1 Tax=Saitoella complicata (strain BCRC 22490 / CBS 7301 / JCM 7358 / NBRC 10748 / NRRL Y-17804) TaxID=698492 RepID=UPI0008676C1B|nr:RNI-like protein [Saitoella complicata NRRL Y-17804]ODQ50842.1 RNI-like protein [Saitoella complicata NRRL Y-17804]
MSFAVASRRHVVIAPLPRNSTPDIYSTRIPNYHTSNTIEMAEEVKLSKDTLALFKHYSGWEDNERVKQNIIKVRDEALGIYAYPCLQRNRFLESRMKQHFYYNTLLQSCENAIASGGSLKLLDVGCCFGTDVRQLVLDGFPAHEITALDMSQDFIDLGYKLFHHGPESLPVRFIAADMLADDFWESHGDLKGAFDVVYTGSFYHLFDEAECVQVTKVLAALTKPGGAVFGRQRGHKDTDEAAAGHMQYNNKPRKLYSPKSFATLWKETVGWEKCEARTTNGEGDDGSREASERGFLEWVRTAKWGSGTEFSYGAQLRSLGRQRPTEAVQGQGKTAQRRRVLPLTSPAMFSSAPSSSQNPADRPSSAASSSTTSRSPGSSKKQNPFKRLIQLSRSSSLIKSASSSRPSSRQQEYYGHPLPSFNSYPTDSLHTPAGTPTVEHQEIVFDCVEYVTVGGRFMPVKPSNHWRRLPTELKLQILSHLSPSDRMAASRTCKDFQKHCSDGSLWSTFDTKTFYSKISADQLVKLIASAGSFIQDLNLRGCAQLREKEVDLIAHACRNLSAVSLEGVRAFDGPALSHLLTRNSRLLHLDVSTLNCVTNSTCQQIALACPRLETIDLSWCSNVDARGVQRLLQGCSQIKSLAICECTGFNQPRAMLALHDCETLERLHMSGCTDLSDDSIKVLMEGLDEDNYDLPPPKRLTHLNLSRCKDLTDAALRYMAGPFANLKKLEMANLPSITDNGLCVLLGTLPSLTHLDLENCAQLTDRTLSVLAMAPCAPQLKHLQLSYCEQVTDVGVGAILQECAALKQLDLDNTKITNAVLADAVRLVRHRPQGSPHLCLVCYDCANVTWAGVREVLSLNAEIKPTSSTNSIVRLKCYYGWQKVVNAHTRRVLRGDIAQANHIEKDWAAWQMCDEEITASGNMSRYREHRRLGRRRLVEIGELDPAQVESRRSRCSIM